MLERFSKRSRDGKVHKSVRCRCACGAVRVIRAYSFDHGRSLGCKQCSSPVNGRCNLSQGCGEITGYTWSRIRINAEKRDLLLAVSIAEVWDLFLRQERRCALTGLVISFAYVTGRQGAITASLDRIDSSKPYTLDNVQLVHKDVNMMKKNLPEARFIEICTLIANQAKTRLS